jgi:hypothetical protein
MTGNKFFFPLNSFVKSCYGVFETPLFRNAQKRHKQISKNKNKGRYLAYVPHLAAIWQIDAAFNIFSRRTPPCIC